MTWRRSGIKPFFKAMMTKTSAAWMQHAVHAACEENELKTSHDLALKTGESRAVNAHNNQPDYISG